MSARRIAEYLNDPAFDDFLDEIRGEILAGIDPPEEIAYSLTDFPDSYAVPERWESDIEEIEDEDDQIEFAERFVRAVWNDLAEKTSAWHGAVTDHDRLHQAFNALRDQGIRVHEFSEWAEVDDEPGDAGTVITPYQFTESLRLGAVELPLDYRALEGDREALGKTIVEVLTGHDLKTTWDPSSDGPVLVELDWHPHIDPVSPGPEGAE